MNLLDYAQLVRRLWWLLVAGLILGAVGGYILAAATPASYSVRSTLLISVLGDGSPTALQSGNVFAMQRAPSYARMATSRLVLEEALTQVGPGTTLADLRDEVTATDVADTGLINIDVSGPDPKLAQQTAIAVGDALASVAGQTDTPGIESTITITTIDPPSIPTTAVSPQPRTSVVVGGVVGLILGIAVMVGWNVADSRIRALSGLPRGLFTFTAVVPSVRKHRDSAARHISVQRLGAQLRFGSVVSKTISVMPISASENDELAWELATVFAELGSRVVLVDIDPIPAGSHPMGVEPTFGLSDVLTDAAPPEAAAVEVANGIDYLGGGRAPLSLAALVSGAAMPYLLTELSAKYDHVVMRCPSLMDHPESIVMGALSESTVLVIAAKITKRVEVVLAAEILEGVHARNVGAVLDGTAVGDLRSAIAPAVERQRDFINS